MPPDLQRHLTLVDCHYGGDVSRIVLDGVIEVPGNTVLQKRAWLAAEGDGLRRLLLYPPYGDPQNCVNLIVEPDLPEAEAGYVIMETMGYPYFSGSNSICVVTALLESGALELGPPGVREVLLEAPAGLIRAHARHDGVEVLDVTLEVDPAWVAARGQQVQLPGLGPVTFDVVWSGCFYAVVDAAANGFALTAPERGAMSAFAHDLCLAAAGAIELVHPVHGDTGPLSFVAFAGPLERTPAGLAAAAATYVHPDVVCACPTGTGTAARLALLVDSGLVHGDEPLLTTSPTGSTMSGRVLAVDEVDGRRHVRATITGRAHTLGRQQVVVNADDPLVDVEAIWPLLRP